LVESRGSSPGIETGLTDDLARFSCGAGIVEFGRFGRGWNLARISDGNGNEIARGRGGSLWRLHAGSVGDEFTKTSYRLSATLSAKGGSALLSWKEFEFAGSACTVDLDIREEGHGFLSMGLLVKSDPPLPLQGLDFPIIGGLATEESGLCTTYGYGQVTPGGGDGYDGRYPGHNCSMQFISWISGSSSLYLGCHDGGAATKHLRYSPKPRPTIHVHLPVAGAGDPVPEYSVPYPTVLGLMHGNWYDVARSYRDWASGQEWFPGERVVDRNIPDRLREVALWALASGDPEQVLPRALEFKKRFDVPMAMHWYLWHQIPFDDHYPEYLPAKDGFVEAVRELQEAGIRVMPYINARLWDSRTDSWREEGAVKAAAKDASLDIYTEEYGSGVPLSPMCPTTALWRGKVGEIVHALAADHGVQGIYLDQIAAAAPKLCFDRGHGHPVGGGSWWVKGYRRLLRELREDVSRVDPDFFLTTESNAEPWNDLLDALLMCNSTVGNLVPLYPAVYGDRVITFGSYIYPPDIENRWPFRVKVSQMFLWGTQLGWLGFSILEERFEREAEYLAELARTRVLAADYLLSGEMLRPPAPDPEVERVRTSWDLWKQTWEIDMPGAQATAWRNPGGKVGLVACNMTESETDLLIPMDLEDLGWSRDRARRMASGDSFKPGEAQAKGDRLVIRVSLGPGSAVLLG